MAGLEISAANLSSERELLNSMPVVQPFPMRCSITKKPLLEGDAYVLFDNPTTIKQTPDPGYIMHKGTTDGRVYSFFEANRKVVVEKTGQSMQQVTYRDGYNPSTGTIECNWYVGKPL